MTWNKRTLNTIFSVVITLTLILITTLVLIFGDDYLERNQNCNLKFPYLRHKHKNLTAQPLLLTPYIQFGQIDQARKLSFVGKWKGVESYSGFFTVNEISNSNLFFWYFPNENHSQEFEAPLILYLQGGPSLSSMLGLFLETGPFRIDENLELSKNEQSWTKYFSVLYIDSPVGTGYSDTNDTKLGYAKNQFDVGRDLYEALLQFFKMFPKLRIVEFYIAGTSYAAKYIPTLAHKIHLDNKKAPENRINLKGLAIGSGYYYYEALVDGDISNYYYNLGFLDRRQTMDFKQVEQTHQKHFHNKMFDKAREVLKIRGYLHTFAGFENFVGGSALEMKTPALDFQQFLNNDCIKTALHVGNQSFFLTNLDVYEHFSDFDYMTSPKSELEELLNANYRVLIYNAQFDVIIPHTTVSKFFYSLSWNGTAEYAEAQRKLWKVDDKTKQSIAGFVTETGSKRLTMVLIRNSGHMACADQPIWCLDMISRFINGQSFASSENIVPLTFE